MEKSFVVYKHTNKINGKIYIGLTCQKTSARWKDGDGYKGNEHFYKAIKKYNWKNFEHKILIHGLTEEQAKRWERRLIKYYNCNNSLFGYNKTEGGDLTNPSDTIRNKIRQSKIGGKNPRAKKVISLVDLKIFNSQAECASYYKINKSTIQRHCINKKVKIRSFMFLNEFYSLNTDQQNYTQKRAKDKINVKKKSKESCSKERTVWNKGKKCPQLTGSRNGMYNVFNGQHPRAKKIIRLSDLKIYDCLKECAKENNIHVDTVRNHCIGKCENNNFMYYTEFILKYRGGI